MSGQPPPWPPGMGEGGDNSGGMPPSPGGGISTQAAEMIGTMIEGPLLGIYLIFFPSSLLVLYQHNQARDVSVKVNKIVFIAAWVLFACVTTHWAIDVSRLYRAFIINGSNGPPDSDVANDIFFSVQNPQNGIRTWIFTVEMLTLDALLVYRLFVIWSKAFWVLIPAGLALVGTAVASFGLNIILTQGDSNPDALKDVQTWTLLPFIMSLCTNVIAVSLIAYRLLRRDRALRESGAQRLSSILLVIVESAALYCAATLAALICTTQEPNLGFIFIDIMSPMTGISYSLIILRVGLARTLRSTIGSGAGAAAAQRTPPSGLAYAMQVRVTRDEAFTVTDGDLARAAMRGPGETGSPATTAVQDAKQDGEDWAWHESRSAV